MFSSIQRIRSSGLSSRFRTLSFARRASPERKISSSAAYTEDSRSRAPIASTAFVGMTDSPRAMSSRSLIAARRSPSQWSAMYSITSSGTSMPSPFATRRRTAFALEGWTDLNLIVLHSDRRDEERRERA